MKTYENDFGPFEDRIWLNTASEGPLPKVAVEALKEAVEWKIKPFYLTHRRFQEVPLKLKAVIARLLHVSSEDVILGNSATYGIHLLANGIPFKPGDEILLMQNDFPSDILPWLGLKDKGVEVRQIPSQSPVLDPDELKKNITPATRLVCLPHVHTFSGYIADIEEMGKICRSRNIIFVVNLSQSAGYFPIDLSKLAVDAVTSAAFKWMCGPYGTGFAWMAPALRETLRYNQAYWVNLMSPADLESTRELKLAANTSAGRYDVFGTANFFNFCPLTASIEYLLNIGIDNIQTHNDILVERLISGLDIKKYQIISPIQKGKRSALIFISHKDASRNKDIFDALTAQRIYGAFWKGNIRFAPHIFNSPREIDRLLAVLNALP